MTTDRTIYVANRLAEEFLDIGAKPFPTVTTELWDDIPHDPQDARYPLGFISPLPPQWVFNYCPERIAQTSLFLDDEEFAEYVNTIAYIAQRDVLNSDLPIVERIAQSDRDCLEAGPGSLYLLSQVHLAWLDRASR